MFIIIIGILLLIGLGATATVVIINVFNQNENNGSILDVYTENGKNNRKKSSLPYILIIFILLAIGISFYFFY